MRTFAAMRRRVVPGITLAAINYIRPEASGPRTVAKVQTNGYWYTRPAHGEKKFWFEYPPATHVRFNDPNTVTFMVAGEPDRPLVTIVFPEEVDEWKPDLKATIADVRQWGSGDPADIRDKWQHRVMASVARDIAADLDGLAGHAPQPKGTHKLGTNSAVKAGRR